MRTRTIYRTSVVGTPFGHGATLDLSPSAQQSGRRPTARSSAFAQEDVVGGVGRAARGAGFVAGAFELAALRVDPLRGRDSREDAVAALGNHRELQPGNIVRRCARSITGGLADHGAAVAVFPVRPGIVPADGLPG